jgi:purine-binding chemotaxis protein CheW
MPMLADDFLYDDEDDEDTLKDKYLTFRLAGEDYGLEVRVITEIVTMQKITEVPDLPAFVRGVINLRGQVIPVIDLRMRFGLEARPYDDRTCMVVSRVDDSPVGLVVDAVNETCDIPASSVSTPPQIAKGAASRFVQGLGRVDDKVVILLNADKLLGHAELEALAAVAV